MGEVQGVRVSKAEKGADTGSVPEVPASGDDDSGQSSASVKTRKVWVVYAKDGSDYVLFGREVPALRHATKYGMKAKAVDFGVSLVQQLADEGNL